MTHPLISILFIYSPKYSRGLRILDLYIHIKITFIFALIPYYLTDNSDFSAVKQARSVADKGKNPGDLPVGITKVF